MTRQIRSGGGVSHLSVVGGSDRSLFDELTVLRAPKPLFDPTAPTVSVIIFTDDVTDEGEAA